MLYLLLKVVRRLCEILFVIIYFKFYINIIENMYGYIEFIYLNLSLLILWLMVYI